MKHFVAHDKDGRILVSGISAQPELMKDSQVNVLITDKVFDAFTHYVAGNKVLPMPKKPSNKYSFNYKTKQWEEDSSLYIREALQKRSSLLAETDWTQLPDVPEATRNKWVEYRQLLRDITKQEGYPLSITWPNKENY